MEYYKTEDILLFLSHQREFEVGGAKQHIHCKKVSVQANRMLYPKTTTFNFTFIKFNNI